MNFDFEILRADSIFRVDSVCEEGSPWLAAACPVLATEI